MANVKQQNDTSKNLQSTSSIVFTPKNEKNLRGQIKNYHEFYRFYLTEHQNMTNRRLHLLGSSLGLYFLSRAVLKCKKKYVAYGLVSGYACAWLGHFIFEKNKPTSFNQPIYSFIADWNMFADVLAGKLSIKDAIFDQIHSKDSEKFKL